MKRPLTLSLKKLKAALKCQKAYRDGEFSANDSYNEFKFGTDFQHASLVTKVRHDTNGIIYKAVTMKDVTKWIESQTEFEAITVQNSKAA